MLNSKQEKKFQEMVKEGVELMEQEKIAKAFIEAEDTTGQPDPREQELTYRETQAIEIERKEYWDNVLKMDEDIPEPQMKQRVKTAPGINGEVKRFGSFQEEINEEHFINGIPQNMKGWNHLPNIEDIPEPQHEAVDKPSHYKLCGMDTMPMLEKILGTEGYLGFLKGNALKYRLRVGKKKGNSIEQDVAKAMYYEDLYNNFVLENTPK